MRDGVMNRHVFNTIVEIYHINPQYLQLTVYILIAIFYLKPMFEFFLWCTSFSIYVIFYLWHNVLFLQAYNIRSYGNLIWNRYNMWKNATKISHWFISMLTRSEKLSYIVNVNEPQPGFQGFIESIRNKIVDAIYLIICMWRPAFIMRCMYETHD